MVDLRFFIAIALQAAGSKAWLANTIGSWHNRLRKTTPADVANQGSGPVSPRLAAWPAFREVRRMALCDKEKPPVASSNPARPNVLFILSDDQGFWALGCAGNSEIRTPNLDRLAHSGIRFDNFFCTSPVCSPARPSLMTGGIPSQHGVHDWVRVGSVGENRVDYLAGQTLVTDVVAADGYRCGLVGKWHLGASDVPRPEFVTWFAHQSGMGPYYGAPMIEHGRPVVVAEYLSDALAAHAIDFVRDEAPRSDPFWLYLTFTAPHYLWLDSHPKAFTDLYADCAFESCPQEPPHPWFAGGKPAIERGQRERRESLIGYFAAVSAMDAAIGRVLDELDL